MTQPTPQTQPDLYRRAVPWSDRERAPLFCSVIPEDRPARPLAVLLDRTIQAERRQLYVTCGWDAAHTPDWDWWKAPAEEGWQVSNVRRDPAGGRYTRGGVTVNVRSSAAWFSDCNDTGLIRDAYLALQERIRRGFDRGAVLMGSPARTGADLLERSLPQGDPRTGRLKPRYPAMPAELQDILRHNYGQGRMEFCVSESAAKTRPDALYVYDAKWMYAACVRGWPVGPWLHDDVPDFEPYRPGWYRVSFQAPPGWEHIGLLPMLDVDDQEGERTIWPTEGGVAGGWHLDTWASEQELRLALGHGWNIRIRERILAAKSNTLPDPAREWQDRLVKLRNACDYTPVGRLMAGALRNLLIQAVGYLYRADRRELHITPAALADTIPADAEDVSVVYPGGDPMQPPSRIEWFRPAPLDAALSAFSRPEWAASTWAQARARLATFALRIPREMVAALRTDSVITTEPLDDLMPSGFSGLGERIGEFRLKATIPWRRRLGDLDETTYRAALDRAGLEE